jgi:hypothetical protein
MNQRARIEDKYTWSLIKEILSIIRKCLFIDGQSGLLKLPKIIEFPTSKINILQYINI